MAKITPHGLRSLPPLFLLDAVIFGQIRLIL